MEKSIKYILHNPLWFVFLITTSLFFIFLHPFGHSSLTNDTNGVTFLMNSFSNIFVLTKPPNLSSQIPMNFSNNYQDSCLGNYIYVHDLPSRFNDDVVRNCTSLMKWFDLCPYVINQGLGPQLDGIYNSTSWFATNQFFLEVIFRNRMKNYKCLTTNSSLASAIYVPVYAGFDVGRYLWGHNISVRDSLGLELTKWLSGQHEWTRMSGRDHFFVSGRIGWDFRRVNDEDSSWGNNLMNLPESMNMTMLSIESTSWSNEFAIPYPTYFHPSTNVEVHDWKDRMRRHKRRHLFSFAGARRPTIKDSIRNEIINQCLASKGRKNSCYFLDCSSSYGHKCDDPVEVMQVFQDSVFCLQPPGDSFTRRSIFDSILGGCIPVFFNPGSAYAQYIWHFPRNYTKYSVFIPANLVKEGSVSIREKLLQVPKMKVAAMREEVINLIPRVIYANPNSKVESMDEDAFDIAVKGVIERVEKVRRDIKEGKDVASVDFAKENSWKLKLSGIGNQKDWDTFF